MSHKLYFEIPGPPVAKGRAKASVVCGHVNMRTPEKTARYENLVCLAAEAARPDGWVEIAGPVVLQIVAVFPRPKKLLERYKDGRLRNGASEGRMPHYSLPDLSNVVKAVEDGMNHASIWQDDARIHQIDASKWYAAIGELPRVEVRVSELVGGAQ